VRAYNVYRNSVPRSHLHSGKDYGIVTYAIKSQSRLVYVTTYFKPALALLKFKGPWAWIKMADACEALDVRVSYCRNMRVHDSIIYARNEGNRWVLYNNSLDDLS
jgi:hypothetical protein